MPGNSPQPDPARAHASYTMEQIYDFPSSYELPRDPGEKFEYSNLSLLGHALALRARQAVRSFAPGTGAGTAWHGTNRHHAHAGDGAPTHPGTNGFGDPQPYFVAPAFIASGSLKSTMNDMLRFAAANLPKIRHGVYGALRDSRRPLRPIDEAGTPWRSRGSGSRVAGLNGGTSATTALSLSIGAGRAIIVMTNIAGRESTLLGVHLMNPDKSPRPSLRLGAPYLRLLHCGVAGGDHAVPHTAGDGARQLALR